MQQAVKCRWGVAGAWTRVKCKSFISWQLWWVPDHICQETAPPSPLTSNQGFFTVSLSSFFSMQLLRASQIFNCLALYIYSFFDLYIHTHTRKNSQGLGGDLISPSPTISSISLLKILMASPTFLRCFPPNVQSTFIYPSVISFLPWQCLPEKI